MDNPIDVINIIKDSIQEVVLENNLTEYKGGKVEDLLRIYSADFCSILLTYFPSATVMISKNYLESALLISGKVYNATGIVNTNDYLIASSEEISLIKKGFKHVSDFVLGKLLDKMDSSLKTQASSYSLRMGDYSAT